MQAIPLCEVLIAVPQLPRWSPRNIADTELAHESGDTVDQTRDVLRSSSDKFDLVSFKYVARVHSWPPLGRHS